MKRALILSGIYWDEPLQRHQQFAKYLSKNGYEVVFVERIMSSQFSFSKFLNVIKRKILKSAEYSVLNKNDKPKSVKTVDYGFVNPEDCLFKYINKKKIQKFLRENGKKYDLVINYLPINTTRIIIEKIKYRTLIYDCVRNFREWKGYRSTIAEEERWLIEKCDKIFTDSYFLTDQNKDYGKEVVQFLPIANENWIQGCSNRVIKEINNIAYFGSVESHIDMNTLRMLQINGLCVHFWGVHSETFDFECEDHGYLSDMKELAKQITSMADAIVLPYRGNMNGVMPAKMIQCLSSGLPVFITKFYDSEKLKDFLYLYDSHRDLIDQLKHFDNKDYEEKKERILRLVDETNEFNQYTKFVESVQNHKEE